MLLWALCRECNHKHPIDFDPIIGYGNACADWYTKHAGHQRVEFAWPERSQKRDLTVSPDELASMVSNADAKVAYAASTTPTMTLASLAASSTFLAGRESSAIDNGASNKYLDMLLAGHYRTAATNLQAGAIRTHVVGARDDTPNWPDVFDGTDSTETVSASGIYDSVCRRVSEITTDATQRTWSFGPVALASFFGGNLPDQFVLFVSHTAHTSTNAWSSTEGDHALSLTGVYATVI